VSKAYLVDTNVLSELRKGSRAEPRVLEWFGGVDGASLFLSVLVIGEIRRGIENIRRRDGSTATVLEAWLNELCEEYSQRVLPVCVRVAQVWGQFNVPDPLPVVDSLIAATAHVHGLTVVTRNTRDIGRTGVPVLNPFEPAV